MSAPTLFKYFTTSKCPFCDAEYNGVQPSLSFALISALHDYTQYLTTSKLPFSDATCKLVLPS